MRLAREALRQDPAGTDWEFIAGYGLMQSGDYAGAAASFSRVTQHNPEDIDAWNLLGETRRVAGNPAQAARTLEHAATIGRTSEVTFFLLGEAYRDLGRPDRSIPAYRESLRLDPSFAPAWFGLGLVYRQTGRREELREVQEQLQKLNPALADQLSKGR